MTSSAINAFGSLYAGCKLSNFELHGTDSAQKKQRKVIGWATAFCKSFKDYDNRNILLIGPSGTGKDRIMFSMARAAEAAGVKFVRFSGAEMWALTRDVINGNTSESDLLKRFTGPDLLIVSDPVLPGQSLTDWQSAWLYRITELRVSRCKPVWMTLNVKDEADAKQRMTEQAWGRLTDGGVIVGCAWESWRKPAEYI